MPQPRYTPTQKLDLDEVTATIQFPDGHVRCWNPVLDCWVRGTLSDPVPLPRITSDGTPKQLAARALAAGDIHLAASYLEQGEGTELC